MSMKKNARILRKKLRSAGLPFRELTIGEECILYRATIGKFSGKFPTYVVGVGVEDDCLRCRSVFPVSVPKKRRRDVAEYMARANYDMKCGTLQLNFDDGTVIAYCSCMPSLINEEGNRAVECMFALAPTMLDAHSETLLKVIAGELSPLEAYKEFERRIENA